jgi:hypothetical protein
MTCPLPRTEKHLFGRGLEWPVRLTSGAQRMTTLTVATDRPARRARRPRPTGVALLLEQTCRRDNDIARYLSSGAHDCSVAERT